MMLSELLPEYEVPTDVQVMGLTEDSRQVGFGDLFCAYQGDSVDGKQYVPDAVRGGAVAILSDGEIGNGASELPVVMCPELRGELGEIAARFYQHPSAEMDVIAVTGTNGKTSFTQLLAQALGSCGSDTGVIGTMGYGRLDALTDPGLTTPPAIGLQRRLSELQQDGCTAVVLEASSHGLVQGRLNGTDIQIAVMTNVTHDHLDYHGSFDAYVDAKCELFRFSGLRNAVINLDDPSAVRFLDVLSTYVLPVTYGRASKEADVRVERLEYLVSGIQLVCTTPKGAVDVTVPLLGSFNAENLLAVIATLIAMNWSTKQIEAALEALQPVAGRMEIIIRARTPTLIIDYAHTPDALAKCLDAVREHFGDRHVTCVFGCGGDRDTAKRPMMGGIAARRADQVVVTSDNPRSEDPERILEDVLRGIPPGSSIKRFVDRGEAIRDAIAHATDDAVVLVAGKGHEDYQELSAGRVAFSDREVGLAALESWGKDDTAEED